MLGCLRELDAALRERGSGLVVRHGPPAQELVALAAEVGAEAVLWTSDVAPYARARDTRVTEALRDADVQARPQGGTYVVDVSKPRTQAGKPFTVFSPFHRHWRDLERRPIHRAPAELPALPSAVRKGRLPSLDALGLDGGELPEPHCEPGERAARDAFAAWLDGPIDHYADRQNGIARKGTSGLSPYLRWGCISAAECEARAARRGGKGASAWIRQICWRDFYAHVLLTHPQNATQEFQPRYRELEWASDDRRAAGMARGPDGLSARRCRDAPARPQRAGCTTARGSWSGRS